jgi:hypothetical protein
MELGARRTSVAAGAANGARAAARAAAEQPRPDAEAFADEQRRALVQQHQEGESDEVPEDAHDIEE